MGPSLAQVLVGGGRLLVAGNGGSAAQAQHLTAELVGRYRDDRPALSAIALHAETSAVTAISNDYGYDHVFARQVQAHGRPGDVFLGMSTSGRSGNVLAAMDAAREGGLTVWVMTGAGPNPMADAADSAVRRGRARHRHRAGGPPGRPAPALRRRRPAGRGRPAELRRRHRAVPGAAGRRRTGAGVTSGPLVVVGDTLLDRDLVGTVDRLCPDAPVPVVDEPVEHSRPGGAGLAALLAASDGRDVVLVTALSRTPAAPSCATCWRRRACASSTSASTARRRRRSGSAAPAARCSGWTAVGPPARRAT